MLGSGAQRATEFSRGGAAISGRRWVESPSPGGGRRRADETAWTGTSIENKETRNYRFRNRRVADVITNRSEASYPARVALEATGLTVVSPRPAAGSET